MHIIYFSQYYYYYLFIYLFYSSELEDRISELLNEVLILKSNNNQSSDLPYSTNSSYGSNANLLLQGELAESKARVQELEEQLTHMVSKSKVH